MFVIGNLNSGSPCNELVVNENSTRRLGVKRAKEGFSLNALRWRVGELKRQARKYLVGV